jgi:hypothetical protein
MSAFNDGKVNSHWGESVAMAEAGRREREDGTKRWRGQKRYFSEL